MTTNLLSVSELRHKLMMSQSQFSDIFHIPKRTIQNWEQESRKVPLYVLAFLNYVILFTLKARGKFNIDTFTDWKILEQKPNLTYKQIRKGTAFFLCSNKEIERTWGLSVREQKKLENGEVVLPYYSFYLMNMVNILADKMREDIDNKINAGHDMSGVLAQMEWVKFLEKLYT